MDPACSPTWTIEKDRRYQSLQDKVSRLSPAEAAELDALHDELLTVIHQWRPSNEPPQHG